MREGEGQVSKQGVGSQKAASKKDPEIDKYKDTIGVVKEDGTTEVYGRLQERNGEEYFQKATLSTLGIPKYDKDSPLLRCDHHRARKVKHQVIDILGSSN